MKVKIADACQVCSNSKGGFPPCTGRAAGFFSIGEKPTCFSDTPIYLGSTKLSEPNIRTSRPTKDEYYLGIALAVSKGSTCLKRHYGCVIVKNDTPIATGYNGSPRGEVNCCDSNVCKRLDAKRGSDYDNCVAVHAEQNAITVADGQNLRGATLYLACQDFERTDWSTEAKGIVMMNPKPCVHCTRMIKNAGIIRVVNLDGDVCL